MYAKSPPPLSYILLLVACGFVVALYWPCASDFSALSTHGLTSTLLIGYGAIHPLLLFTSFLPYLSGADLHMAQLMPLPLTVSCFRKVQIGLPFWYRVTRVHTYTHPFNGPLSGSTRVSRYQKGKTNLDFTEATGSEWQWHQLGRMQVCTSLQTDNHASSRPLSFFQAGCPSCRPTDSVKALKAQRGSAGQKAR